MGAVSTYSYAAFQAQFSNLSTVPSGTVQSWWNLAGAFHDNSGNGPVQEQGMQDSLMNMVAAHLLVLMGGITVNADGSINQGVVGRVSNASEGSVSIASENNYPEGTVQWWQQTQFGSMYWMATAPWRSMQYRPGPQRQFSPPLGRVAGPGGWWPARGF